MQNRLKMSKSGCRNTDEEARGPGKRWCWLNQAGEYKHRHPGAVESSLEEGRLYLYFSQLSHSVMSSSLWPHGLQYARFPIHQQLPELAQTQVHQVGNAIQPSHPLSSPSPPTFNLSQHQGLFKWVSSSHQVAKVLEFQLQHQSCQWIFRVDFL